jgi:uncharacterized protein YukE
VTALIIATATSDVAALIGAIGGLIGGIAGLIGALAAYQNYKRELKERIKAEELKKDAERREEQAEDTVTELQRSLAAMQQLLPCQGETMDDKMLANVRELINKVDQLTGAVNQIRQEVDELKLRCGGTSGPTPPPSETFDDLKRQLEQCIESRGLKPESRNRFVWNSPKGRIPVLVIRRGAQNHRVLFPDCTDDTVPVNQLSPL